MIYKQTIVATSPNHAEILAIHVASQECARLKSMTQDIQETYGSPSKKTIQQHCIKIMPSA